MIHQRGRVPASVTLLLASSWLAGLPIFNDGATVFDTVIVAHRERQGAVVEASQTILARAEAEARDLTEAEQKEVGDLTDEFESLENQIGLRERVLNQQAALGRPNLRRTDPDEPGDPIDPVRPGNREPARNNERRVEPRIATARGTGGFRGMGDFAMAVRNACVRRGGEMDARLRNAAATTIGAEGVGADGGFAVPPDFRAEIAVKVFGDDSLVARTDRLRSGSNSITIPTDMTTPWDSTGGIQAYWDGESGALTQSKPKLEEVTYKAQKLHVLVPMTEELLEDAPALDAYLRKKAPEKMDFKISNAIVRGTGAGQPLGYLNSPALVTVAAEGGQSSGTIVSANISKMYARMPASSLSTSVWLINPDATEQLDQLVVGQFPVFVAFPGGLQDAPAGRIKGRPVILHQVCDTLGNLGDIMFVDLNQYMTLTKLGNGRDENGMRLDISMHLWFDQDLTAYRFTIRIGGQPWWSTPTAPFKGSNNLSPFVTLAAR